MGTRADFYIGIGAEAEWLGSIAWDGYPDGDVKAVFGASTEDEFRELVTGFSKARDDFTAPDHGWPWPWDDSRTTDYSYAFHDGKVMATHFGHGWQTASGYNSDMDDKEAGKVEFPDMHDRKNFTLGKRSGVIVVGI